jgi:hypothetical protein
MRQAIGRGGHDGLGAMIIRHKHKGRFTVVPNSIFNDDRLCLGAKGLLGYLLSLPGNWQVRHDQLQHKLRVGRKLLNKLLLELEKAGYLDRDDEQARDEPVLALQLYHSGHSHAGRFRCSSSAAL